MLSKGRVPNIYDPQGNIIAIAHKDEKLCEMKSYINLRTPKVLVNKKNTTKERLHRILGHVNFNKLKIMCKNELLEGRPKGIESDYLNCATCIENKMHNSPFNNNRRRVDDI